MRTSKLIDLMNSELPTISQQKRKLYKTNSNEVKRLYKIINEELFNNKLKTPKIVVKLRITNYWGMCIGIRNPTQNKSGCQLEITQNHFCKQWLIMILAHEMAHQYQWDVLGLKRMKKGLEPIMNHGPTFYIHRKKFLKHHIPLKRVIHSRIWFNKQNLLKC